MLHTKNSQKIAAIFGGKLLICFSLCFVPAAVHGAYHAGVIDSR